MIQHALFFHRFRIRKLTVNHFCLKFQSEYLLQKLLQFDYYFLSFFLEYVNQLSLHESIIKNDLAFLCIQNPMYKRLHHQLQPYYEHIFTLVCMILQQTFCLVNFIFSLEFLLHFCFHVQADGIIRYPMNKLILWNLLLGHE